MDYLSQILADSSQERTVTIKTKPGKKEQAPEAPLDPGSANLPQGVLDMLMLGQAQKPSLPPQLLAMMMQNSAPAPAPMVDPMMGQIPMMANPYGG